MKLLKSKKRQKTMISPQKSEHNIQTPLIIDNYEYGVPIAEVVRSHGLDRFGETIEGFDGREHRGVLRMRQFNLGRLAALLSVGTDRDSSSDAKHYNGLTYDELEAVRIDGRSLIQYTYANSLFPHGHNPQSLWTMSDGVAIYRYGSMEPLYHKNWNGLHRFVEHPTSEDVVAVIYGPQDPDIHADHLVKNHPSVDSIDHRYVKNLRGVKRCD